MELFTAGQIGTLTLPNRVIRSATQDPFGRRVAPQAGGYRSPQPAPSPSSPRTATSPRRPVPPASRQVLPPRTGQPESAGRRPAAGGHLILQLARRHECLAGKSTWQGAAAGPLRRHESPQREKITAADQKIRNDFVDAAKAAQEMGFDGIQLHCAHGYLLSQFLDPNTNHRTDEFGGSAENRFRFAGECLSAIRRAVGKDYPILVKVQHQLRRRG